MANEISGLNSSRTQHSGDRQVAGVSKDSKKTSESSTSSTNSDRVSLTDTAERLKALEHQLAQQPEVDNQRVSNVQEAITNGNYKVDPERVADKMMSFEASFSKRD